MCIGIDEREARIGMQDRCRPQAPGKLRQMIRSFLVCGVSVLPAFDRFIRRTSTLSVARSEGRVHETTTVPVARARARSGAYPRIICARVLARVVHVFVRACVRLPCARACAQVLGPAHDDKGVREDVANADDEDDEAGGHRVVPAAP